MNSARSVSMGHLCSDGTPFHADEIRRLERALVSLTHQLLEAWPEGFDVAAVKGWHRLMNADLPRMFPGEFREADIAFGSFLGTPTDRIEAASSLILRQAELIAREDSAI